MQKVVLAIVNLHSFSYLHLHYLFFQQRPKHTSLMPYYVRPFKSNDSMTAKPYDIMTTESVRFRIMT